ncbi:MAG: hypothetical protein ACTSR2_03875, partial [Candidatus Hodarchaeales archaeon]
GILFDKIYSKYLTKLQGKHLGTHQPMISQLYRSLYHEQELGMEFEAMLFQYYAISNSCDDIIDETPVSNRKDTIANITTVFVSFFIFFEKLVQVFLGNKSNFSPIFDSWHINLPVVLKAPFLELNPPKNPSVEEAPRMLVFALKNRCVDHQLLCHFLDRAFKKKYSDDDLGSSYNLENVIVLIKSLEFLVKDLSIYELKQDMMSKSFNILVYLRSLLYLQETKSLTPEMYQSALKKTKELIYEEFRNACIKIPERSRLLASKYFYEQEELFSERLEQFEEIYAILTKE